VSDAPSADASAHLQERTLSSQEVLRGDFLQAFRDRVQLPDGREASREYVQHPGAVAIVAQLADGRYIMERQWRYPLARAFIEFPAGKLDAGEDPLACAQRELLEETGYRAKEWAYVGPMHPVIAYSTEVIHFFFARDLMAGERQLDEGEFLDVFAASLQELLAWSCSGDITDGKTLSGLLWAQNVAAGLWPLDWQRAD